MSKPEATIDQVFTLHKYWIWANQMKLLYYEIVATGVFSQGPDWYDDKMIRAVNYMSYWYGGLYVVVEGWKRLALHDPAIDGLLASPNVKLLKDFRNSVFHYHPEYFEARFNAFMEATPQTVPWVTALNNAFSAYFLTRLNREAAEPPAVEGCG